MSKRIKDNIFVKKAKKNQMFENTLLQNMVN